MQSEQQQRIMGYFIEEAKDHLNTIEQGLLNLQSTIEDPDLVHEVFRAAHSVKGGAAMLGLDSIQKTAHRLEDYFKVLKECPVPVDQKLESLFLRIFDTLQELVEQLQGPFGLTDDNAVRIMGDVEPVLGQLNDHLKHLVDQSGSTPPAEVDLSSQPISTSPSTAPSPGVDLEDSALRLYFQSDVPAYLREMLQYLKQPETSENRNQLQHICSELAQAGDSFDLPPSWNELILTAQRAIANPDNSFRVLAPAIIKDFKHAQE
ncbi:MAG: Hpt domain-containing protein, partial [Elainellaceae cyanobacterium]